MDDLADRDLRFDGVKEADELLMPVALHVASDHCAIEAGTAPRVDECWCLRETTNWN